MTVAKWLGGSNMYGLNTPESDEDVRELFINTEPAFILGTKRFDQEIKNDKESDIQKTEIRRFLELAKKGNTQAVEVLFAEENAFTELKQPIRVLRSNKDKLVDSDVLFKVISSFIYAQSYLVFNDKRTAEQGSKRAIAIEKYGFVPKAASTIIRLAQSGIEYFHTRHFPVFVGHNSTVADIKFNPESYTKDSIKRLITGYDDALKKVYDNTTIKKTKFEEDYANQFLLETYMPYLKNYGPL